MQKLFHFNINSRGDFDKSTVIYDRQDHPFKVKNIGLVINKWPVDRNLFHCFPILVCSELLKNALEEAEMELITFEKIERTTKGLNLMANDPDGEIPKYWRINFPEVSEMRDFGIYNNAHLVVTEHGLKFLRNQGIVNAKEYEIGDGIEEYFKRFEEKVNQPSKKNSFWSKFKF